MLSERLAQVTSHIHVVLSPEGQALFEQVARPPTPRTRVTTSVQPSPVGMGDAVFGSWSCWRHADRVLVVWGDQLGVSVKTMRRAVDAHRALEGRGIAVPLVRMTSPYVSYVFDDGGRLVSVRQAREGDDCGSVGLSDVGTFVLSAEGLEARWREYLAGGDRRGAKTKELNFLPLLSWLSCERGYEVARVMVDDADEARGMNTPKDLAWFQGR